MQIIEAEHLCTVEVRSFLRGRLLSWIMNGHVDHKSDGKVKFARNITIKITKAPLESSPKFATGVARAYIRPATCCSPLKTEIKSLKFLTNNISIIIMFYKVIYIYRKGSVLNYTLTEDKMYKMKRIFARPRLNLLQPLQPPYLRVWPSYPGLFRKYFYTCINQTNNRFSIKTSVLSQYG